MRIQSPRSSICRRIVAVLLLSLLSTVGLGQSPAAVQQAKRMHGRILDMFGDGVPAAEVTVHPENAPHVVLARCRTDGLGDFFVPPVADDHRVVVRARAARHAIGSCRVWRRDVGVRLVLPEAVTVRGVLRDAERQPVAGVVVRGVVMRSDRAYDEFATSAADGSFTMRGLSCGHATFTAVVPGQGICSTEQRLVGDTEIELQVPPFVDRDTNLTVMVAGLPFEKLAQARVRVSIDEEDTVMPFPHCGAPLDAFGVATLPDLPAANYRLQVHCPGVRIVPNTYTLGARFRTEIVEFVAEELFAPTAPATVELRDRKDRTVAAVAVRLTAFEPSGRGRVTRAVTGSNGRVEMPSPVPSGEKLWFEVTDPRWAVDRELANDDGQRAFRMLFKRGVPLKVSVARASEVRGMLLFKDERPAGAVNVELWKLNGSDLDRLVAQTCSEPDGSFRFDRLSTSSRELRVVVNDLAGCVAVSEIRVDRFGEVVDLGRVVLHEPASVRGVVRNPAGEPMPGMHVWLTSSVSNFAPGYRPMAVVTDARGRYGFSAVPPGEVELHVNHGSKPTNGPSHTLQIQHGLQLDRDIAY